MTTAADEVNVNGNCSLREAVINADNNDQSGSPDCSAGEAAPVVDMIGFDAALDGVPIELSIAGSGQNAGDLDVSESVSIVGNGLLDVDPHAFLPSQARTIIDATTLGDRAFDISVGDATAEVLIGQLAIVGGTAEGSGGAVSALGGSTTLVLEEVVLADNIVTSRTGLAFGGALSVSVDTLQVRNSLFLDNRAQSDGGDASGGAISSSNADVVEIVDSGFFGNRAQSQLRAWGGALSATTISSVTDVTVRNVVFESNMTVDDTDSAEVIEDGAHGGSIYFAGIACDLEAVTLLGNSAVTEDRVAIGGGARIDNPAPGCIIENSTFSGNSTTSNAGSVADGFSQGGALGLVGTNHSLSLNNVTVTDNEVGGSVTTHGGGLFVIDLDTGDGDLTFIAAGNTIIAGNRDPFDDSSPDCFGAVQSGGYTLLGNNDGCDFSSASGDVVGDVAGGGTAIDPADVFAAGGIADNDGGFVVGQSIIPQSTHLLVEASPALDAGDPTDPGGTCSSQDQRGVPRPLDGDIDGSRICDMGALELRPDLPDLIFQDRFE